MRLIPIYALHLLTISFHSHVKSECPNARVPREGSGACFNCGETGHNKSDCPNPAVPREFTGECRLCAKTGHRASECPDAPPKLCKNCGEEGIIPTPELVNITNSPVSLRSCDQ